MPVYEYICDDCKKQFSVIQSVGTTEKETTCTECGSGNVHKLMSSFSSFSTSSFSPSEGSNFSGGG
ncbi:MAG: zinc ribbon domain-containing protein [Thermodesulfovibrionia bacterium]|nr:zinc ribbon domain-containing protein [Thermodesulfovibrionia bacterium]